MRRRDFLRNVAGATLYCSTPGLARALGGRACAPASEGRPLWITIDAFGAWDCQFLCDPVDDPGFAGHYAGEHILEAGALRHAPYSVDGGVPVPYLVGPDQAPFFDKYRDDLLVINGIDHQTNSHDVGRRNVWSGSARVGHPSLGALMAAIEQDLADQVLPLSFISTGGYDNAQGLIPVARSGAPAWLMDLARPIQTAYNRPPDPRYLVHPDADAAVARWQDERLARGAGQVGLPPSVAVSMERFAVARQAQESLTSLAAFVDPTHGAIPPPGDYPMGLGHPVFDAAHIVVAAMAAGICHAGHLSLSGFDTHSLHDLLDEHQALRNAKGHRVLLRGLLEVVDFVAQMLCDAGLWDRAVVLVGSDFGRTRYNGDNPSQRGKDHWPITSMLMMGGGIAGGRVVGETRVVEGLDGVQARGVRLDGDQVVADDEGFLLTPAHIHAAARHFAGVEDHPVAARFPLDLSADELAVARALIRPAG